MPRETKLRQEKRKKREERRQNVEVKTAVSLLNPKTIFKILLSMHARTSNILHLDQKFEKGKTCKWLKS